MALIAQVRQTKFAATVDNLWRFDDQWRGDVFIPIRLGAAAAFKAGKDDVPQIADIMGFFEMLGLMERKGAIDRDVISNNFGYWAINYWYLCESRVNRERQADKSPELWSDFEGLKTSLETQRSKWLKIPLYAEVPKPTDQKRQKFLEDESKLKAPDQPSPFLSWLFRLLRLLK